MASLTIYDLPLNQALDAKAMSCIRGSGGAPWVYGWIAPFNPDAGNSRSLEANEAVGAMPAALSF